MSTPEQMEAFKQYLIDLINERMRNIKIYAQDAFVEDDDVEEHYQVGRIVELEYVMSLLKGDNQ